ncbi:HAD family phosphatase [Candidatus Kuenenbacteria bacterium]|nr:HAD family phosphatase [Candidatus Kuenenbacteria bacterium]
MPETANNKILKDSIRAIIFDLDGVLIKNIPHHIVSWQYAFKKFGINATKKDLLLLEGMSYKETINFILKKYSKKLNTVDREKIHLIKKEKVKTLLRVSPYPYVSMLLKLLKKRGLSLALVSGANKKFVQKIVDKFFKNFFKVIISGDDTNKNKPNPEPYLLAIKKLKFNAKEILVIENSPLGIKSAKKAGLTTYAIKTTLHKKFLLSADKIFFSHKKLLKEFQKSLTGP